MSVIETKNKDKLLDLLFKLDQRVKVLENIIKKNSSAQKRDIHWKELISITRIQNKNREKN
tara:strand:+ start:1299 stop:1481 length:183 start_codon:yes stop_codon:yes gene_type:complete